MHIKSWYFIFIISLKAERNITRNVFHAYFQDIKIKLGKSYNVQIEYTLSLLILRFRTLWDVRDKCSVKNFLHIIVYHRKLYLKDIKDV